MQPPEPRRGDRTTIRRPSGALMTKGCSIPGLASRRPGLLSVVPPGLRSAIGVTLLPICVPHEYNVAANVSGTCPERGMSINETDEPDRP